MRSRCAYVYSLPLTWELDEVESSRPRTDRSTHMKGHGAHCTEGSVVPSTGLFLMMHCSILHERLHELNYTMRDISFNISNLYTKLMSICLSLGLIFFFQVFKFLKKLQLTFRFADIVLCSY